MHTLRLICVLYLVHNAFAASVSVWQTLLDRSSSLTQLSSLNSTNGDSSAYTKITIGTTTYQEIHGYGGALTEATTYNLLQIKNTNGELYTSVMNALFSPSTGAGFTMVRVPMGSTDMSLSPYFTYAMTNDDHMLANWSWNRDAMYMLPVLKDIIAINPNVKVVITPWTAPIWMKTFQNYNYGSIKPSSFDDLALYFQVTIQKFAAENINVYALSVQNEPLNIANTYPVMGVNATESAALIKLTSQKLSSVGLGSVKIIAYDHNWDNTSYALEVLESAGDYVSAVAWHCYAGEVSAQSVVKNAYPDKEAWFTECSGTGPSNFNNIIWATYNLYFGSLNNWASTVLHWNYMTDTNYEPHTGGCAECRGIVTVDTSYNNVTYNEEYYGMAMFSKFLKYPAYRLQCTLQGGYNCVTTLCIRNADKSILIVVANFCQTPQAIAIQNDESYVSTTVGIGLTSFIWGGGTTPSSSLSSFSVTHVGNAVILFLILLLI